MLDILSYFVSLCFDVRTKWAFLRDFTWRKLNAQSVYAFPGYVNINEKTYNIKAYLLICNVKSMQKCHASYIYR